MIVSGVPVTIIDTAGVVESKDPIEKEGVLRTKKEIEKADIVLSLSAPNIKEVSVIFTDRTAGESKMSGGIVYEALFGVIKMRLKGLR